MPELRMIEPVRPTALEGLVEDYLASCRARGLSLKTKAAAQVPSRPKRVLDVLSREEMQALEDAAKTERDKLMIRLMADTGMRVSELLGLRNTDLMERDRNHYIVLAGRSQGGGAK